MLDLKFIRANLDLVRAGIQRKKFEVDLDRLVALDDRRKELEGVRGDLRNQQKAAGKEIAQLSGDDKQRAIQEMGKLPARIKEAEQELRSVEEELQQILAGLPMPPAPEVPDGVDDTENVEISRWGDLPEFAFEPKDHVTLGLELGIMDFQRAAKLAGSQTYILLREGALLELAVLRLATDTLVKKGYAR